MWLNRSVSPHRFDVIGRRKAVATVNKIVDVLAGIRQLVEAPGSNPVADGEGQFVKLFAVLFADHVVVHPDGLIPVADIRFGTKADILFGVGDRLDNLGEQVFDDLLPIDADHHVVVVEWAVVEGELFHRSCKKQIA